jgi:hypothetical protein
LLLLLLMPTGDAAAGVVWDKALKQWRARVVVNALTFPLGCHDDEVRQQKMNK